MKTHSATISKHIFLVVFLLSFASFSTNVIAADSASPRSYSGLESGELLDAINRDIPLRNSSGTPVRTAFGLESEELLDAINRISPPAYTKNYEGMALTGLESIDLVDTINRTTAASRWQN